MRKFILLLLTVVLTIYACVSGTLSVLEVRASASEVQTSGSVKIENMMQKWENDQLVLQAHDDKTIGDTVTLYPCVGQPGYDMDSGYSYRRLNINNAVDKYLAVKNTGSKPAYVRTFIAMEAGSHTAEEFQKVVGYSRNVGLWSWVDLGIQQIDGENYYVICAVYNSALASNAATCPSLLQLYLRSEANNETMTRLDGNGDGCFEMKILSQAVEADTQKDAGAVLKEVFPAVHPWESSTSDPTA